MKTYESVLKQDHGHQLKIIGFWVDIIVGSIALSPESISLMILDINRFLDTDNRCPPLINWQKLGGYLNWALNVMPWARPALACLYAKMRGKIICNGHIPLNATVHERIYWFINIARLSSGVRFTDSLQWPDTDADMVAWTDASGVGLSFVYAGNGFTYRTKTAPASAPTIDIFWREMLAILSLVHYVGSFTKPPRRLLVHSLDSVAAFNSLVLLGVAEVILRTGIDLRVRHIPGKDNIMADLLSRNLLQDFGRQFPSYRVRTFEPPCELLLARWRECL